MDTSTSLSSTSLGDLTVVTTEAIPEQRSAPPAAAGTPQGQSLMAEVRSSGLLFGLAAVVTVGVAAAVQAAATLVP